jgi:transcription elongation factor Elf1
MKGECPICQIDLVEVDTEADDYYESTDLKCVACGLEFEVDDEQVFVSADWALDMMDHTCDALHNLKVEYRSGDTGLIELCHALFAASRLKNAIGTITPIGHPSPPTSMEEARREPVRYPRR